jgi:long-chain acyl-CoA synthetase
MREKVAGVWMDLFYADLWSRVRTLAAGLREHGFTPGAHAAILAPSSPRWVQACLAILHAEGVVVPVDKEYKAGELRHVLGDSEVSLIFTTPSYLEPLSELRESLPRLERIVLLETLPEDSPPRRELIQARDALFDEWQRLRRDLELPEARTQALENLAHRLYQLLAPHHPSAPELSPAGGERISPFCSRRKSQQSPCLLAFDELPAAKPAEMPEIPPDRTAVILYTSGTTGRAKGAMLSHGNIVSNIQSAAELFRLGAETHTLSFLPINHVFEQVCGVLLPLSLGGCVSFAESLKKLGENLAEVKPTCFLGVPALYRIFFDRIMKGIQGNTLSRTLFALPFTRPLVAAKVRKSFGHNTLFVSGGAALDPEIARGFQSLGLKLVQGYGITETAPVICAEPPDAPRIGTVGIPLRDVQVKIDQPNGEGVGEILVRGPNVMRGYYNNPEATDEVLTDGWYRTGDLGSLDGDGYLTIRGRVRNLIVTPNGKNVYPEEVELELLKSPYIAEVMVYGHKISASAEEVHALIYPDADALDGLARARNETVLPESEVEELFRREVMNAGKQLADYKRVKKFTLREDEFPKTTTRKIKRFAVEARIPISEHQRRTKQEPL